MTPAASREGGPGRAALLTLALILVALFLVTPLTVVFVEALRRGGGPFLEALREPDAIAAIKLTLLVAAISVPANTIFVGSSRVDLQACKLEYSIVSPK